VKDFNNVPLLSSPLLSSQCVVKSISDIRVCLYYRFYQDTRVGDKYLYVVVKGGDAEDYVLTAYLTDKVKKGEILWNVKS
jgi:hypothetical protein